MDYTKTITPAYELCGKRKRLTGFIGQICDGAIVLHSAEYPSYSQAETATNAVVYDLLMDLAERGLSDTVPVCDPPNEPSPLGDNEGDDCPEEYAVPLFDDIAQVIDMALGNAPAKNVIPELRRIKIRLDSEHVRRIGARGY
jgi:hypothetical protein